MSDLDDERPGPDSGPGPQPEPQRRRRRSSSTASKPKRASRFDRRAEQASKTIRELIRLRRPDLDIGDKTFVDVVERDAEAWGRFLARLGEWVLPFGQLLDAVERLSLLVILELAPSIRAARRDLRARSAERKARRAASLNGDGEHEPQFGDHAPPQPGGFDPAESG